MIDSVSVGAAPRCWQCSKQLILFGRFATKRGVAGRVRHWAKARHEPPGSPDASSLRAHSNEPRSPPMRIRSGRTAAKPRLRPLPLGRRLLSSGGDPPPSLWEEPSKLPRPRAGAERRARAWGSSRRTAPTGGGTPQIKSPTTFPIKQFASAPAIIERTAIFDRSGMRSFAIAPMPPS